VEPLSALHIHGKLRPRRALVRGYFRIRRWLKPLFQIPDSTRLVSRCPRHRWHAPTSRDRIRSRVAARYALRRRAGRLAMLAAMRRASSRVLGHSASVCLCA
jgi:hypothetical protein